MFAHWPSSAGPCHYVRKGRLDYVLLFRQWLISLQMRGQLEFPEDTHALGDVLSHLGKITNESLSGRKRT